VEPFLVDGGFGVVALVSAALEAFTPFGLDNITVPLGTATLAYMILGIL
jgi:dolichol kinase